MAAKMNTNPSTANLCPAQAKNSGTKHVAGLPTIAAVKSSTSAGIVVASHAKWCGEISLKAWHFAKRISGGNVLL